MVTDLTVARSQGIIEVGSKSIEKMSNDWTEPFEDASQID
jgi:hypothetical protein